MHDVVRVAGCQITSTPDPDTNLRLAGEAVARAAEAGARIAVLPEATMATFEADLRAVAEPLDGRFATGIRELADTHDITVVVGVFEPADDGRVHNTLLLTGRGVEASYRKIHMYDAFGGGESKLVAPGTQLVTVPVDGVPVGVATCYDVRFADQFTALGRAGAQLVILPASWGEGPGKAEQWDVLLRARAMDAQAWLLGVDQAWTPPKGKLALGVGRSALVDPTGHVRAQLGPPPDVLVADVDLSLVESTRATVPIL